MLPSRRELNFCIIAFFKLYPETLEKSSKKALDFEVKIEKNREKNVSKKYVFFDCVFLWILAGFGGFWEGFGGSWRLLGHFLASFFGALTCNTPKGLLEAPGIDFGSILKGLARVLGWVLGGFLGEFLGSL